MQLAQQILFILLLLAAVFVFAKKARFISRNINLGRDENLKDNPGARWRNMMLLALGQKRMFDKPIVALLHLAVYVGFVIINIEILEIILDGIFGTHRLFAPGLGAVYTFVINFFEVLAFLVLTACIVFLIRRNITKVQRLSMNELNGWPKSDANYILVFEIVLMSLFLIMNATDRALQLQGHEHYHDLGRSFWVSGLIAPLFQSVPTNTLVGIERTAWWLHIAGIFVFLNYLPYSKHLHILLAFPNTYFARLQPQGKMQNMPEIQNEVLYAMEPEAAPVGAAPEEHTKGFGAKDVTDLSWKNLLDAYTCTECGRCTENCPANQTGKLLSPRKIMMDTRDRMEEVGHNRDKNIVPASEKKLLHDYITAEELRACTSCQACIQACPVLINPLDIINQLRRYMIMEESNAPQEWNGMFSNIENNFAPWKFSPDDRDKWAEEMNA
ncbi:MAG: (Fe-S)-binding protein [Chitinophagaceae bacterium]